MTVELDRVYRSQRLRLRAVVVAQAARLWAAAETRDQERFVTQVVPVVHAGQTQTVRLVDAYMAMKTLHAVGVGQVKGLDPDAYMVEAIRKQPAVEVYARPFGAVGYALQTGAEFATARVAGGAALEKLVTTDLQLAQTHSARDWMSDEPSIIGYERVTAGGCPLCEAASDRLYHSADLAPIHEGCRCDVTPVYGDRKLERLPDGLQAVSDSELGARLVDDKWAAAA